MSIDKPFHRCFRGIKDGDNSGYSGWAYVLDRDYAKKPEHYTRAYHIIQKDLQQIFEYIEPSDVNFKTFSFRTHELLVRTCIEIEANFKAILKENTFNPKDDKGKKLPESKWNMRHYKKVNATHHLSKYKIILPIWSGEKGEFYPFKEWDSDKTLSWYKAYNQSKHDRHVKFEEANFEALLNAISGLVVILSAQFGTESFSTGERAISSSGYSYYDSEPAIGELFHIEFPDDWQEDEIYDFNWSNLMTESVKFQQLDFDK
jgi:hypothetical protein